jgi:hypothetical protein
MSSAHAHLDEQQRIRHLRRRRIRVVQRQRRHRILGAAAALAFALTSALGVASFTGTDLAGAAATRAQNLMELLDKRSPGQRTEGQLTKTKSHHRMLADRLPAPDVNAPVELAQMIAPPPSGLVPVDVGAPSPELSFLAPPQPAGAIFFPPQGGTPGGGGGPRGGCCGEGTPPGTPTTPTPPAVPEPGTWMTMLFGFGLIGWVLRRQKLQFARSLAQ